MKKIFFSMLLAGSSCAALAQVDSLNTTMTNDGSMITTSDYNAFSTYTATPPIYVNSYILKDYPAATDVRWRQEGEWWHSYHVNNGMPVHVYINDAGQSFNVALPVRQSWVPETVVNRVVELYGPVVYDINTISGTNEQEIYTVRLLENGQLSTIWVDANGNRVMDVHRMETSSDNAALGEPAGNLQYDENTKMKMKVENADGSESKTKIKNGEVKIKTENADGSETKTKIKNGEIKTKTDD